MREICFLLNSCNYHLDFHRTQFVSWKFEVTQQLVLWRTPDISTAYWDIFIQKNKVNKKIKFLFDKFKAVRRNSWASKMALLRLYTQRKAACYQ